MVKTRMWAEYHLTIFFWHGKLNLIFNYHTQSDFSVVLLAKENLSFQNVSCLRYTLPLFLRHSSHQAHRWQKHLLFCRTPIKTLEIIPRPTQKQAHLPKAFETSRITGCCMIHIHCLHWQSVWIVLKTQNVYRNEEKCSNSARLCCFLHPKFLWLEQKFLVSLLALGWSVNFPSN